MSNRTGTIIQDKGAFAALKTTAPYAFVILNEVKDRP